MYEVSAAEGSWDMHSYTETQGWEGTLLQEGRSVLAVLLHWEGTASAEPGKLDGLHAAGWDWCFQKSPRTEAALRARL